MDHGSRQKEQQEDGLVKKCRNRKGRKVNAKVAEDKSAKFLEMLCACA